MESLCADLDDLGEPVTWQATRPRPLACRPNEIRRAVRNLVENAVAYGRKAEVQTRRNSGDGYEIVVEDEGPRHSRGRPDRVFEPFVRLESSRNADTGGTGLGLTLVKAIAEGHGGAVMLENRRRRRPARARMRLPRRRRAPAPRLQRMQFGQFPLPSAAGAILAHGVRAGDAPSRKGRVLSADDIAALQDAGISRRHHCPA